MKFTWMLVCAVVISVLSVSPAWARSSYRFGKNQESVTSHKLSGGVTWYTEIPGFTDYPLSDRDMGYNLYYEYHESGGFWQLGASYIPSPDNDGVKDVLTPEINLLLKDKIYRLGTGALISYVDYGSDTDWTEVYFQFVGGLEIPIGSFGIELHGRYVFKSFRSITDSQKGGPAYSVLISYTF